jgi:hypothetical protein
MPPFIYQDMMNLVVCFLVRSPSAYTNVAMLERCALSSQIAVSVLKQSFGIINWNQEEIEELDKKQEKV